MGKVLLNLKRKRNNSGSTIVIVLIMTSFVLILSTLITTTTMVNLKMKMIASQSKKTFYTSEEAVDEIYAALGKASMECFNASYEEQLTTLSSYSKVVSDQHNNFATLVEIDNEKANVALRENYMQKLIGKLLPDFKTTDFRPVYNNNYSFDGHKEKFIEILNSYLENYSTGVDKDGNATGEPILVVQDVNTIRMRNTSDKNNGTGLNVYAITFTDCVVKYLTQNGDYSYITFNGAVGLPDIYVNFMDEDLVGTTFFGNYALVGNTGINITDGGAAIIKGNAYAGRASGLNIKGSTLDFTGSYLICGGSLNLNIKSKGETGALSASQLNLGGSSQLWSDEIVLGNNATFNGAGAVNVKDDLTIEGDDSSAVLSGSYEGFGYEPKENATHYDSSAVIINGERATITFSSSLSKLVVAGRSYIKFETSVPLATGESISVNTNQEIYLVPAQLLKSGSKNPSKKKTAGNGIKCETKISESTFFGFDLLSKNGDDYYVTRDYDIAGSGLNTIDYDKSRTYYYFSFKDTASLNTYAKIIYDYTDTQFEEFLNNTSYAQKCSAAEKNDYIKESKSLRNAIKKSVGTYAGLSGSSVVRSESLTDGASLGIFADNSSFDFNTEYSDRSNRYNVFNKILAPLGDSVTYTTTQQAEEYLNSIAHNNIAIDLSKYTPDDVYDNIINKDGFAEVTDGKAFIKQVEGKWFIAYALSEVSASKGIELVIDSNSSESKSNILKITSGVVVCSGNVHIKSDFDGIVVSNGIITIDSGVTVSNNIFSDSLFRTFIDDHEAELTDTNGKGKTVHYKDIFRFWNPHVESKKDSSLSVSNMTYKDMVTFSLWRKYEDPKGTNVESTTEAPTNPS